MSGTPKDLSGERRWRETARRIRDEQWRIMEAAAANGGAVRICPWDKKRVWRNGQGYHHLDPIPGEFRFSLLSFMETFSWFDMDHPDWFTTDDADWDEERQTHLYRLTDAGRRALEERDRHDMEPVKGGLVEPGWQCVPIPKEEEETT